MLGNETDARFIRDWYLHKGCYLDAPKGWTRLGSGCYRTAFLSPDGVVYKVQQNYAYSYQTNKGEVEVIRRYWLRKLPRGCRFPRYQFFELDGKGVTAMERLPKLLKDFSRYEENSPWTLLDRLQEALVDVYDLHGANIGVDEVGMLVPIDMGG